MHKSKLLILLLVAGFALSGCTISVGSGGKTTLGTVNDGGVWISADKGVNWRQMSLIPTVTGKPQSIATTDVVTLTADPQDPAAVYMATRERGLFYTYNVNNGWNHVSGLGQTTIRDVKVDPKNKCVIFAAALNRLYRSEDCGRGWQQVYFDNNPGVAVTVISIDHYNSDNVYIGTSRGDVIKSIDHGISWRTIQRIEAPIARIIVSPQDSRQIFVATTRNDIYRFKTNTVTNPDTSGDIEQNFAVENWEDIGIVLKDFKLGNDFRDLVTCANDGTLFLATTKAIVRSADKGITWENIKLITPEKDAIINAVAVNPKNSQELFYVTNTTFFRSLDGGVTWTSKKLPTTRAGSDLLVDFNNPNIMYMGTLKIDK